uniref:Uncharacterized protein n=1 Tax=Tanacetum cinerariifolium TaxID=118510 RepID=A0A699GYQ7_TANCI|nr:hypothetical protein [Tanacetum cinerariifolium]
MKLLFALLHPQAIQTHKIYTNGFIHYPIYTSTEDTQDRDLVLRRRKKKSLDYNNSFLGEYECSSLALDREQMRDEKEEIGSLETRSNNPCNCLIKVRGYIHILADKGKIIYSYHVKDKTISFSSIPCVAGTNNVSTWTMLKCTRLGVGRVHVHGKQNKKGHTEDEIVIRSCKGLSYLFNFRNGVLKMNECHKLSPLPYVGYECRFESDMVDDDEPHLLNLPPHVFEMLIMEFCVGIITLTDPMFGDKYFIKTPQELICDFQIKCSSVKLPPSWRIYPLDVTAGEKLYSLTLNDGGLDVFKKMDGEACSWMRDLAKAAASCCKSLPHCFHLICDQNLLRAIVGKFGESVEMANKIYFSSSPIMYYSLETCRFHTLNNEDIKDSFGDILGMKHHLSPHGWIEPRWS